MSIIEGVGDEVTIFVTIFFILTGLLLAWLTTTLTPASSDAEPDVTNEPTTGSEQNDTASDQGGNDTEESGGQPQEEPPDSSTGGTVRNRLNPELSKTETPGPGAEDGEAATQNTTSQSSPEAGSSAAATESPGRSSPPEASERLDGHIRLKIKYLDERERFVQARPDENIENFKRTHFAGELSEDLLVRLIYNGQELRGDTSTLSSYNIGDMSVVHCLITRSTRPQEPNGQVDQDTMEIDLSNLMFPLFGLILGLIWYCRIAYRNFFNAMSTLALIGITVLFLFACVITLRNRPHEHFPPPPQQVSGDHQHQE